MEFSNLQFFIICHGEAIVMAAWSLSRRATLLFTASQSEFGVERYGGSKYEQKCFLIANLRVVKGDVRRHERVTSVDDLRVEDPTAVF